MVQERYITAREVAERVGLSPDTVLRYYREGRIPGRRLQRPDPAGPVPVERGRGCMGRTRAAEHRGSGGVSRQRGQIYRQPSGLWAIRYYDAHGRSPAEDGVSHEGRGA